MMYTMTKTTNSQCDMMLVAAGKQVLTKNLLY